MALASRTFLCSFVPLVVLLVGSFWALERAVVAAVRESFRSSLAAGDSYRNSSAARSVLVSSESDYRRPHDLDIAVAPVASVVRRVLLTSGLILLAVAFVVSRVTCRAMVRPIEEVVIQLREWERSATIPSISDDHQDSSLRKHFRGDHIAEVRELINSFSRAATVIRDGQENLHQAYVECVGSLASALDARDCYTAGHSHRVSEYSCAIAESLGLDSVQLDELRIGALLHDIGKIGVPDSVLQSPGKLTGEDLRRIRQHPEIGRKILQGVHGFAPYLSTVELHHENWDGTGYPHGLVGEETPLAARIVHVADAYDAMTSDRPYRSGMRSEDALRILEEHAGKQFDPAIVEVFVELARTTCIRTGSGFRENQSLRLLAESLERESKSAEEARSETESSALPVQPTI